MALQKLSMLDMHIAVMNRIQDGARITVVDHIELNQQTPFTTLELVGQTERNTKTMYVDRFTIHVHVFSSPDNSSISHYQNIDKVREALTEYIALPEGYNLFGQTTSGLLSNFIEKETNERHAVLGFVFDIAYGFKIKI